ncbi:MAG: hypothetical protein M1812_002032 [Candelaria pacifica]|nr:MAG: hypothetical protein M1812_002032 [Candelaria pacifica]
MPSSPTHSPQDTKSSESLQAATENKRQAAAEADLQRRQELEFAKRAERERPWEARLLGKKLVDKPTCKIDEVNEFSIKELPSYYRIIQFGYGEWCDDEEERLTIYLDKDGAVKDLRFG